MLLLSVCVFVCVVFFFLIIRHPPNSPLFPYTTLFRSHPDPAGLECEGGFRESPLEAARRGPVDRRSHLRRPPPSGSRLQDVRHASAPEVGAEAGGHRQREGLRPTSRVDEI